VLAAIKESGKEEPPVAMRDVVILTAHLRSEISLGDWKCAAGLASALQDLTLLVPPPIPAAFEVCQCRICVEFD
jgi:hypothetical protein